MMGVPDDLNLRGIIPNCFAHIFGVIDQEETDKKFLVRCSYLEIYNEEVYDLLTEHKRGQMPEKLELHEDSGKGVFVKGLKWLIVKSIPEMEQAMNFGTTNRKTASTKMNVESSRSHSIFTIYIETGEKVNGQQQIKAGKLNLVDLAGSERNSKTGATGQTMKEGIKINLSLTALGNVISSLVDGKSQHIPYRDSKLTRLLQDSLGGNTKTVMIAACSPANYNYDETLSTLRYAHRAKQIKNKPRVNEDPKDALLKKYEEEIKQLKEMLAQFHVNKQSSNPLELANAMKQMASFKDGNDILMKKEKKIIEKEEVEKEEVKEKEKEIKDFTVSELIAQLEAKGKKIAIIEPGAENMTANELLNDREDLEDSDRGEATPPPNGDQARTGTFGGAKLDGTIKEGYQLNAFAQAQA